MVRRLVSNTSCSTRSLTGRVTDCVSRWDDWGAMRGSVHCTKWGISGCVFDTTSAYRQFTMRIGFNDDNE